MTMPLHTPMAGQRRARWPAALLAAGTALCGCLPLAASASEPATCQLSMDNPDVGYGRINPYDIRPMTATAGAAADSIGVQLRSLHVQCTTPTRFALRFRAPADGSRQGYAIGDGGVFLLSVGRAQADGQAVLLSSNATPVAAAINAGDTVQLPPDHVLQVVSQGQLAAVSQLSMQVQIDTRLPLQIQRLREDQVFTGEGVFEIQPLSE